MPRIASFLGIPCQERIWAVYLPASGLPMPKPRLLLSLLSLACSKALQSILISETSSVFFFFFKDWKFSSSSRYYFLSCICSQPTYASLEDGVCSSEPVGLLLWFCVLQKAAKTWALGSLGSWGSSGFPPTSRITALSLGAYFSHAEPQACLLLILSKKEVQKMHVSRKDFISLALKRRCKRGQLPGAINIIHFGNGLSPRERVPWWFALPKAKVMNTQQW